MKLYASQNTYDGDGQKIKVIFWIPGSLKDYNCVLDFFEHRCASFSPALQAVRMCKSSEFFLKTCILSEFYVIVCFVYTAPQEFWNKFVSVLEF